MAFGHSAISSHKPEPSLLDMTTRLPTEHILRYNQLSISSVITALLHGLHIAAAECKIDGSQGCSRPSVPTSGGDSTS
jgi:hypothetical protein